MYIKVITRATTIELNLKKKEALKHPLKIDIMGLND